MTLPIRAWPAQERPRERLLQQGAAVLSDAELLAIFLRTGTAKASAIDLARQLLLGFGGLHELLSAPAAQVMACHGIGAAKYSQLIAALELGRRYVEAELRQGICLDQPDQVMRYLTQQLRSESREVFAVLFLDSQLKLLAFEKLFWGTTTRCTVHVREILRRALVHQASQLIVAHNHPDAPAIASAADVALTSQLAQALTLIDVQLVDHIVIGQGQAFSFRLQGLWPADDTTSV